MSGAFCSAGVVVVGVATEKPAPTSVLCRVQVLLARTQTSALFICSEARRGYREVGLSGGSFTETWLMNQTPCDLTSFSVFCSRLQSVLQKSSGQPRLPTVDGNYTIINLWTVDDF